MANINEPELLDEALPVNAGQLPEQPSFETLQPGVGYTFVLPTAESIAKYITVIQTERGQRIQANLLLKVPAKGVSVFGKITNKEYTQGKEKILVSDMAYLLSSLGVTTTGGNKSYKDALVAHAGESFVADYEWTGFCNPKNPYYDEQGEVEGTAGCGANYATRAYTKKDGTVVNAIPKEDGKFAERFQCAGENCPAIVRAFGQIRRIRAK